MKVCFFIDDITLTGGIERVTSLLCHQFVKNGSEDDVQVEIVSQFQSFNPPSYDFTGIQISYLTEKNYDQYKPHSPMRVALFLTTVGKVRKFFKTHHYDIIIGQSFPNVCVLFLAGVDMTKVMAVEHVYYGYYGTLLKRVRQYIYKRCKKVVVLTNNDKQCFDKELPYNQTIVIPNPVVLTDKYQSSLNSKQIISVGRLQQQKGYDTLIEVFARVHQQYPDWVLNIYGEGNYRPQLEQQIQDCQLVGIVNLCGRTKEIYQKMREAAFYVMSSRFEGFGMVLVEAQSQGLPVISFDCPNGPADIIHNKIDGLLVENQNKEQLYEAICFLIDHPDKRCEMGKYAISNVDRYDVVEICNQWKQAFVEN